MSCSACSRRSRSAPNSGSPTAPTTDIHVTATPNIGGATIPPGDGRVEVARVVVVVGARIVLERFERDRRAERRILAADEFLVKWHR